MAYNTKSIIKDVNGKPVPQYFNPSTNQYEVIESKDGYLKTIICDKNGNPIITQDLVNQMGVKIDELIGVVNSIGL